VCVFVFFWVCVCDGRFGNIFFLFFFFPFVYVLVLFFLLAFVPVALSALQPLEGKSHFTSVRLVN